MTEKVSPTSFRLPSSLLTRFRKTCSAREVNQTEAIIAAIDAWLERDVPVDERVEWVIAQVDSDLAEGWREHMALNSSRTGGEELREAVAHWLDPDAFHCVEGDVLPLKLFPESTSDLHGMIDDILASGDWQAINSMGIALTTMYERLVPVDPALAHSGTWKRPRLDAPLRDEQTASSATVTKVPIKNESPAPATTLEVLLQIGELSQRVNQLATEARIHLEMPRVPQQTNVEEPVKREYNPVDAAALAPPGSAEERLHLEMAKLMGVTKDDVKPSTARPDSGGGASQRTAGPIGRHPAKSKRPA